ncbi:hypothetical protein PR048_015326 [Dryococelus australis]|uniref:Uncharacterized protein n=1 Tax=Dryococelus australis TaxID=614101 RepID=A0ABQ9HGM6_9NEOP|nr:hypothetical protein PR048_015326 [Dryococelus australis]
MVTTEGLEGQLRQLWQDLPQENMLQMFASMPDRIAILFPCYGEIQTNRRLVICSEPFHSGILSQRGGRKAQAVGGGCENFDWKEGSGIAGGGSLPRGQAGVVEENISSLVENVSLTHALPLHQLYVVVQNIVQVACQLGQTWYLSNHTSVTRRWDVYDIEGGSYHTVRRNKSSAGIAYRRVKREIPKKTRQPAASPSTIPTRENPGATPLGIETGSPTWEASSPTTTPLWPCEMKYMPEILAAAGHQHMRRPACERSDYASGSCNMAGGGRFLLKILQTVLRGSIEAPVQTGEEKRSYRVVRGDWATVWLGLLCCSARRSCLQRSLWRCPPPPPPPGAATSPAPAPCCDSAQPTAPAHTTTLPLHLSHLHLLLQPTIPIFVWSGEYERAGEMGDPQENPPTNSIVRHDSHTRKSGVTQPGIEPGSPCWEASRLTAQPP